MEKERNESNTEVMAVMDGMCAMRTVLAKDSTSDQLRTYFGNVLALANGNEQFPVSLDEVWPLVYGRKSDAVEVLIKDFIQDVDYQFLRQNPQNSRRGRPTNEYRLSVSCLEYFIARKVRPVFEVYREVFHKAANGAMQTALPQTYADALRSLADSWEREEKNRRLIAEQNARMIEHTATIGEQARQIEQMKAKTDYLDRILATTAGMTVTQVAQDYGMSAKKFNLTLKELGIQRKVNGQWILKHPYAKERYVTSKTITFLHKDGREDTAVQTQWLQSGRLFLYHKLKENGIIPLIEQTSVQDCSENAKTA